MSEKNPAGEEMMRVTEYHIGEGPQRLKVGIADDGTFLIVLPPSRRKIDDVISLERTNAIAILRHLTELLEKAGSRDDPTPTSEPPRSRTR